MLELNQVPMRGKPPPPALQLIALLWFLLRPFIEGPIICLVILNTSSNQFSVYVPRLPSRCIFCASREISVQGEMLLCRVFTKPFNRWGDLERCLNDFTVNEYLDLTKSRSVQAMDMLLGPMRTADFCESLSGSPNAKPKQICLKIVIPGYRIRVHLW